MIAEYIRTYHEERKRLAADAIQGRARIERRLAEIERALKRLVAANCEGSAVIQQLEPEFLALEKEREELRAKVDDAPDPLETIALHRATLKRYEEQLSNLQAALAKGIRAGDTEAAKAMHELIDTVTISRDPSRKGGWRSKSPEDSRTCSARRLSRITSGECGVQR